MEIGRLRSKDTVVSNIFQTVIDLKFDFRPFNVKPEHESSLTIFEIY